MCDVLHVYHTSTMNITGSTINGPAVISREWEDGLKFGENNSNYTLPTLYSVLLFIISTCYYAYSRVEPTVIHMYIMYNVYKYNMRLVWLGRDIERVCYSLVFRKRGHRFNGSRETLRLVLKDRHPVTLIRIFRYPEIAIHNIIYIIWFVIFLYRHVHNVKHLNAL